WDVTTGTNTATLKGHTLTVASVAFCPDGKALASGSADLTIRLWDVATGKHTATLPGHTDFIYAVVFSPDGRTLASGAFDGAIQWWWMPAPRKAARRTQPCGTVDAPGRPNCAVPCGAGPAAACRRRDGQGATARQAHSRQVVHPGSGLPSCGLRADL